jgi:hypothetical protein
MASREAALPEATAFQKQSMFLITTRLWLGAITCLRDGLCPNERLDDRNGAGVIERSDV